LRSKLFDIHFLQQDNNKTNEKKYAIHYIDDLTKEREALTKLSILDQSPVSAGSTPEMALKNTVRLAQEAEKMGYSRFWVSEHHDTRSLAGSSPEVLISYLAASTEKIRVGSGGVMLPHYSSYKVAENFRILEALAPGRIDLGIGRAPGGMPNATRALQDGNPKDIRRYPEQIDDLLSYLHDQLPENHPYEGLSATPILSHAPELWMLGSSGSSAQLAAEKGLSFTFAHFINGYDGPAAVRFYRNNFKPSAFNEKPNVIVSIFVVCAETQEEAEELASSIDLSILSIEKGMRTEGIPSVETAKNYPYSAYDWSRIRENRQRIIVGTPQKVKETVTRLQELYGADEFMMVSLMHDMDAKIKSYELLAKEFQL